LSGAFAALSIDAVQLREADPPHWVTRLLASAAVATSMFYERIENGLYAGSSRFVTNMTTKTPRAEGLEEKCLVREAE
jgi:hypothetical protein